MTKSIRSKLAPLLGVALLATSLAIAVFPGTASADTAQASAQASAGTLLNFPAETRTGAPGNVSPDNDTPLPTPPALNVGLLGQDTFVDEFGHSAACAGLVGSNGSLNVLTGANGCANPTPGTGVEINIGILTVRLNAVYAECTAGSNALPTANASVAGDLSVSLLGIGLVSVPLPTQPGSYGLLQLLQAQNPLVSLPLDLQGVLTLEATNVGTTKGSGASATALDLLGGLLTIGKVSCGANGVTDDAGQLVMDTSGDIDVDQDPATNHVQDGTRNALTFLYTPAGDRSNSRATFNIDTTKLEFDTADPFFAGCTPVNPTDSSTTCDFTPNGPGGILVGGTTVSRTVPVKIKPGVTGTIGTDPNEVDLLDPTTVRATVSNGTEPGNDLVRRLAPVGIRSEVSTITVQAGGNAPQNGNPAGTQLPTNIPGFLFADVPYYVEYVEYDGVACTNMDNQDPPFVIPAVYDTNLVPAQRNLFSCGLSQRATSDFRITVAPDAPTNVDGTGRIVILRTGPVNPYDPPRIPGNSYTSDLVIDVTSGPVGPGNPDAPAVDIQKTVNTLAAPGGDFTYTITVTNLDDEPARIETLNDTITSGPDTGQVINLNGVGTCATGTVLAASNAGNTDTYTCTFTRNLTGATGDSESDRAFVQVRDTDGDNLTATDTDVAIATIGNAHRLVVTKSVVDDDLPAPGGVFTYNVTITNDDDLFDGDVTITSVVDEISNAADRDLTAVAQAAGCTTLAEGESCNFQFTNTFTGAAGATQDDRILVEGTAADGPATGESLWVRVFIEGATLQGLDVDLTADPASLPEPGGTTKFTLKATNTLPANGADLEIRSLKVQYNPTVDAEDMDASTCKVGTLLEPGETYTCTFTDEITGNAEDSFTYTATGVAEDVAGNDYSDSDPATIVLTDVLPRIRVDETVEPASRKTPGGDFVWKVTVTNESKASSDPVEITSLRNELTLDLEKEKDCADKVLGEILDVGESVSCTFTTKVEGPDGKVATDIVVVTAQDDEGNVVSDLGNAAVSLTAADAPATTTPPTVRQNLVKTGANSRTTAAAAMLFAGLGLVLTGGGMQQAPELALEGQRRRRRRR